MRPVSKTCNVRHLHWPSHQNIQFSKEYVNLEKGKDYGIGGQLFTADFLPSKTKYIFTPHKSLVRNNIISKDRQDYIGYTLKVLGPKTLDFKQTKRNKQILCKLPKPELGLSDPTRLPIRNRPEVKRVWVQSFNPFN